MANITVSPSDVASAANFLEAYLSDRYPTIDLSAGTVFRDILVDGMASVVALLRTEMARVQTLQSLSGIAALEDSDDRDDAIDALLSNFFLTRKTGRNSTGIATLHLSASTDILLPETALFSRGSLSFKPNYTGNTLFTASDLTAVYNSAGVITEYTLNINLVSTGAGAAYDISPGTFTAFTQFNPYVTSVTTNATFSGGSSVETTDDLLARASTAISLRGMVSSKSIRTTLLEEFTSLLDVVVVGFGDSEMHRDSLPYAEFHSGLHRGGFLDVYVDTGILQGQVFEGEVGGSATIVGPLPVYFQDSGTADFVAAGIQAGQYIKFASVETGEPELHVITNVDATLLTVDSRLPFPRERTGVAYTVGTVGPSYSDVYAGTSTGVVSFTIDPGPSGVVILPQNPLLRITDVSIYDGDNTYGLKDTYDGRRDDRIHFSQVNTRTLGYGDPGYTPLFSVQTLNSAVGHSSQQVMYIDLGSAFDGETVRVIYDTPTGFSEIDTYVSADSSRTLTANTLVRSFNPAYLRFDLRYTLKGTADATSVDEASIKAQLVAFINNLVLSEKLNVSDIIAYVMSLDSNIGSVVPNAVVNGTPTDYAVLYSLYTSDGKRIEYYTTDEVVIDETKLVYSSPDAVLSDEEATLLGVSPRTTKYVAAVSDLTMTEE